MNNPDYHELWRDALNDATPDVVIETTLAFTLANARRVRRNRYAIRIAAGASVVAIAGILSVLPFWPATTPISKKGAPAVLEQPIGSNGIPVRYLTDEELLARFPDQPVGLVGTGSSVEFITFSHMSVE